MGASEVALRREVHCFNDESVTFPATTGISVPLLDGTVDVITAIERNDSCRMDQFLLYYDVIAGLKNLIVTIVASEEIWQSKSDAALT